MQEETTARIMETSPAQQRAERAAMLAKWPAGEQKPTYVNDPHFAQFCFAVADALLEHATQVKNTESRVLA